MAKICHACHSPLTFIKTTAGKNMPCELDPIDATEAEDAELYLLPDGKLIRFDMCDSQHMDIEELYVPHWHNCDSARRFRK